MEKLRAVSPLSFALILAIIASLALAPAAWAQDDTGADVTGGGTTEGNVEFTPGYIEGSVSLGGTPLQNAKVTISRSSATDIVQATDADGHYKLIVGTPDQGLDPWTYEVSCQASTNNGKGTLWFEKQNVAIAYGETKTADFNVTLGRIQGKITVPGDTISSGYVRANISDGRMVANIPVASDGTFSFDVQPGSNIRVYGSVTANGNPYGLSNQYTNVTAGNTSTVNWTIASATIRGRVSAGNTGLSNLTITVSGGGLSNSSTKTDANGNYEMTVSTPEDGQRSCTVSCSDTNIDNGKTLLRFKRRTIVISDGQSQTLDFSFSGRINGSIEMPEGAEISSGMVYVKGSDGNYITYSSNIASDGTFSLAVEPDSNMMIWGQNVVVGGTPHSLGSKTLNIAANQTQSVSWTLAAAQVRGSVKVAGQGVANANITITGGTSTIYGKTDANGNYDLAVFIPESGSRSCKISCTNISVGTTILYFNPITSELANGDIKTINFNVTPGYITGRVAVSDTTVSGYLYAKYASNGATFARVPVASDGTFSLPVYPNTDMVIWGDVSLRSCSYRLSDKQVRVGANQSQTLTWTITTAQINGRVSVGTEGVANALISVPASSGLCGANVRTSADGTYVLSLFMPENGTRTCTVSCTANNVTQPAQTVTLQSNHRETVNWTVAAGQIVGRVAIGNSGVANARITVSGVGSVLTNAEGDYSLEFHMSQESGQQYTVSCTNVRASDGTQVTFNNKSVHVSNGETELVNFFAQATTYIGGSVGRSVSSGSICAKLPDGSRICAPIQRDGSYTLPVPPFTEVEISGTFMSETGLSYTIESQTANVSEDDPPEINVTTTTSQSLISGAVSLVGMEDLGQSLDRHYVRSSAGSANLNENGGEYSFARLSPRTYYFYSGNSYYVDSFLNNGDDHFRHPPANFMAQVNLKTGEEVTNDVVSDAAIIRGKISLEGTASMDQVSQGDIYAYGVDGTATESGWSHDKVDANTGDYDLVVSEGDWDVYDIRLKFSGSTDAGDVLNSSLDIKDHSRIAANSGAVSADAGQTIENNMLYETGTVIIRFSVPEGATLRNPRLEGDCVAYKDGQEVLAEIAASGSSEEVTEGRVAFIGIPGTYHLSAFADVISGGVVLADRHFGDVEVTVIANKEQEVNTDGPTITIETPEPGYTTCDDGILVSGTITYEAEITSVLVNEETAEFASANNPDDPNEVAFSIFLDLEMGTNQIEVVAEGGSDGRASKTITLSRYVAGVFTVGDDGIVTIDWLYDGGMYKGEVGIFSLTGMDIYEPNSVNFIREAARRALSNSDEGHVIISDRTEGARFSGSLGEPQEWNSGPYEGIKTFEMIPGDTFATMLVPNYTLSQLYNNPGTTDVQKRPLFSLASANPEHDLYLGQIADINGAGNAFVYEDQNFVSSDKDYNDLIFQVSGVIVCEGKAPTLDSLIAEGIMAASQDWREFTDLGKQMVEHIEVVPTAQRMSVRVEGAADLFVYDPQGRECGKDGEYIPGSASGTDGSISLPALESGVYRLVLRAEEDGGSCQVTVTENEGDSMVFSETKTASIGASQTLVARVTLDADLAVTDVSDLAVPTDAEGNPLDYDFDGDGKTDDSDIAKVSVRWNAVVGDEDYDPFYDLDGDGYIGVLDIMAVVNSKSE